MESLKLWRYKHHMTPGDAAKAAGVTTATWRNWESGRCVPTPTHMMALAKLTKIKTEALYKEAIEQC